MCLILIAAFLQKVLKTESYCKKSGQSQCMRENLLQIALDGEMTTDDFQQKHWANLWDVVREEYVQKKEEITYA